VTETPFSALYEFDRISWNGLAQYVSTSPDVTPRVHNLSRAEYARLGQPNMVLVVVVPVPDVKGISDASPQSGPA
jgi:hypothetical protein